MNNIVANMINNIVSEVKFMVPVVYKIYFMSKLTWIGSSSL